MPAAPSPTRCRGAGRGGRSRCCAARATTAATVLSRRASWPSAAGRCASRCSATARRCSGDAAQRGGAVDRARSSRWRPAALDGAGLVVDAHVRRRVWRGRSRACARDVIEALDDRRLPVVAVDVPSGRRRRERRGARHRAARGADGHLFPPEAGASAAARARLCGETVLAQIGIPAAVLDRIAPARRGQRPGLVARRCFPGPAPRATNTPADMRWSPAAR